MANSTVVDLQRTIYLHCMLCFWRVAFSVLIHLADVIKTQELCSSFVHHEAQVWSWCVISIVQNYRYSSPCTIRQPFGTAECGLTCILQVVSLERDAPKGPKEWIIIMYIMMFFFPGDSSHILHITLQLKGHGISTNMYFQLRSREICVLAASSACVNEKALT